MKVDPSIAEQAAQWWVRLHDEGAPDTAQREFGAWVARSPERIQAYLEIARLLRALKSSDPKWPDATADELIRAAKGSLGETLLLRGNGASPSAFAGPPNPATSTDSPVGGNSGFRSYRKPIWALAAGVLLAVALSWLWLARHQEYSTSFGEQRSVLLSDGSRVTLNTASRIEVEFQKHRRIVRLLQGEAFFSVTHDPAKPFDVIARNTVLRAIGTEFNVDLRDKDTTLTVVEGRVAVIPEKGSMLPPSPTPHGAALSAMMQRTAARPVTRENFPAPPGALILVAAERVVISDAGPGTPRYVTNVAAATGWIEHQVVFDHEALGEVAEQFNRYNHEQIVIEGPDLARKEVTGVFQSGDPGSFLTFLSGIKGVTVHERSDGTYLVSAAAPIARQPSAH